MKKVLTIIVLFVIFGQTLLVTTLGADNQQKITDEEAKDLIERAYSLFCFVNDGGMNFDLEKECKYNLSEKIVDSKEIPDGITKTVAYGEKTIEAIRLFAESVYTDDLVDSSYKVDAQDNSHISYFFASEDMNLKTGNFDYWFNYFYGPSYMSIAARPWFTDEIIQKDKYGCLREKWLTIDTNGNGKAKATVILERNPDMVTWDDYDNPDPDTPGEVGSIPVTVSVEFERTAKGWRISGGEFVNAMCNITATKYKKITFCTLYDFLICEDICYLIKSGGYNNIGEYIGGRLTYLSDKYIKYVFPIECTAPNGEVIKGSYSAYYKYVSEEQYLAEYADAEYERAFHLENDTFLVFYGGGLYDLLVNGNLDAEQFHGEKSAYTGERDNVKEIIIFTSAAIAAACACLCVIRKRKENVL